MDYQIELLDAHVSYKGEQRFYRDFAEPLGYDIELAVYVPVASLLKERHCPVVYYLPELDCSARDVANQSDYQRYTNRYDMILVIPDIFAGLSGTVGERLRQYQALREAVNTYLTVSLPRVIEHHFRTFDVCGLMGYGFGGTVALNLALRYPQRYKGVSLFAPWLGFHGSMWQQAHCADIDADLDPLAALESGDKRLEIPLWLDQGEEDDLLGAQIQMEAVERVFAGQEQCYIKRHKSYDHSFFFVHSHMRDQIVFQDDCFDI